MISLSDLNFLAFEKCGCLRGFVAANSDGATEDVHKWRRAGCSIVAMSTDEFREANLTLLTRCPHISPNSNLAGGAASEQRGRE